MAGFFMESLETAQQMLFNILSAFINGFPSYSRYNTSLFKWLLYPVLLGLIYGVARLALTKMDPKHQDDNLKSVLKEHLGGGLLAGLFGGILLVMLVVLIRQEKMYVQLAQTSMMAQLGKIALANAAISLGVFLLFRKQDRTAAYIFTGIVGAISLFISAKFVHPMIVNSTQKFVLNRLLKYFEACTESAANCRLSDTVLNNPNNPFLPYLNRAWEESNRYALWDPAKQGWASLMKLLLTNENMQQAGILMPTITSWAS